MGENKRSWAGIGLLAFVGVVFLVEHVILQTPYSKVQLIAYGIFIAGGLILLDPDHALELAKLAIAKLPGFNKQ